MKLACIILSLLLAAEASIRVATPSGRIRQRFYGAARQVDEDTEAFLDSVRDDRKSAYYPFDSNSRSGKFRDRDELLGQADDIKQTIVDSPKNRSSQAAVIGQALSSTNKLWRAL